MNLRVLFSLIAVILISQSCTSKYEGVRVDEELIPYFEAFREEAAERGIVFDNSEEMIEGYLQNIPDDGVLGACKRNADNEDNPQIFFDKPYWRSATELEKEYVMFHELGHCFLKLGHDNAVDSIGDCVSIMASGLSDCRTNYNNGNREALIDELFSK